MALRGLEQLFLSSIFRCRTLDSSTVAKIDAVDYKHRLEMGCRVYSSVLLVPTSTFPQRSITSIA